jgi:hypothetical protein
MFHFGRRTERARPGTLPPDLPRPGVADPVRAFAYDALRAGANACWLSLAGALVDAVDPVLEAVPELRESGVRWTGAGVLPSRRAEWWAFDRSEASSSVLLFTGDTLEIERLGLVLRRTLRDATVQETSPARGIPAATLGTAAAARALPAWEVTGFTRLTPIELFESGSGTIAA